MVHQMAVETKGPKNLQDGTRHEHLAGSPSLLNSLSIEQSQASFSEPVPGETPRQRSCSGPADAPDHRTCSAMSSEMYPSRLARPHIVPGSVGNPISPYIAARSGSDLDELTKMHSPQAIVRGADLLNDENVFKSKSVKVDRRKLIFTNSPQLEAAFWEYFSARTVPFSRFFMCLMSIVTAALTIQIFVENMRPGKINPAVAWIHQIFASIQAQFLINAQGQTILYIADVTNPQWVFLALIGFFLCFASAIIATFACSTVVPTSPLHCVTSLMRFQRRRLILVASIPAMYFFLTSLAGFLSVQTVAIAKSAEDAATVLNLEKFVISNFSSHSDLKLPQEPFVITAASRSSHMSVAWIIGWILLLAVPFRESVMITVTYLVIVIFPMFINVAISFLKIEDQCGGNHQCEKLIRQYLWEWSSWNIIGIYMSVIAMISSHTLEYWARRSFLAAVQAISESRRASRSLSLYVPRTCIPAFMPLWTTSLQRQHAQNIVQSALPGVVLALSVSLPEFSSTILIGKVCQALDSVYDMLKMAADCLGNTGIDGLASSTEFGPANAEKRPVSKSWFVEGLKSHRLLEAPPLRVMPCREADGFTLTIAISSAQNTSLPVYGDGGIHPSAILAALDIARLADGILSQFFLPKGTSVAGAHDEGMVDWKMGMSFGRYSEVLFAGVLPEVHVTGSVVDRAISAAAMAQPHCILLDELISSLVQHNVPKLHSAVTQNVKRLPDIQEENTNDETSGPSDSRTGSSPALSSSKESMVELKQLPRIARYAALYPANAGGPTLVLFRYIISGYMGTDHGAYQVEQENEMLDSSFTSRCIKKMKDFFMRGISDRGQTEFGANGKLCANPEKFGVCASGDRWLQINDDQMRSIAAYFKHMTDCHSQIELARNEFHIPEDLINDLPGRYHDQNYIRQSPSSAYGDVSLNSRTIAGLPAEFSSKFPITPRWTLSSSAAPSTSLVQAHSENPHTVGNGSPFHAPASRFIIKSVDLKKNGVILAPNHQAMPFNQSPGNKRVQSAHLSSNDRIPAASHELEADVNETIVSSVSDNVSYANRNAHNRTWFDAGAQELEPQKHIPEAGTYTNNRSAAEFCHSDSAGMLRGTVHSNCEGNDTVLPGQTTDDYSRDDSPDSFCRMEPDGQFRANIAQQMPPSSNLSTDDSWTFQRELQETKMSSIMLGMRMALDSLPWGLAPSRSGITQNWKGKYSLGLNQIFDEVIQAQMFTRGVLLFGTCISGITAFASLIALLATISECKILNSLKFVAFSIAIIFVAAILCIIQFYHLIAAIRFAHRRDSGLHKTSQSEAWKDGNAPFHHGRTESPLAQAQKKFRSPFPASPKLWRMGSTQHEALSKVQSFELGLHNAKMPLVSVSAGTELTHKEESSGQEMQVSPSKNQFGAVHPNTESNPSDFHISPEANSSTGKPSDLIHERRDEASTNALTSLSCLSSSDPIHMIKNDLKLHMSIGCVGAWPHKICGEPSGADATLFPSIFEMPSTSIITLLSDDTEISSVEHSSLSHSQFSPHQSFKNAKSLTNELQDDDGQRKAISFAQLVESSAAEKVSSTQILRQKSKAAPWEAVEKKGRQSEMERDNALALQFLRRAPSQSLYGNSSALHFRTGSSGNSNLHAGTGSNNDDSSILRTVFKYLRKLLIGTWYWIRIWLWGSYMEWIFVGSLATFLIMAFGFNAIVNGPRETFLSQNLPSDECSYWRNWKELGELSFLFRPFSSLPFAPPNSAISYEIAGIFYPLLSFAMGPRFTISTTLSFCLVLCCLQWPDGIYTFFIEANLVWCIPFFAGLRDHWRRRDVLHTLRCDQLGLVSSDLQTATIPVSLRKAMPQDGIHALRVSSPSQMLLYMRISNLNDLLSGHSQPVMMTILRDLQSNFAKAAAASGLVALPSPSSGEFMAVPGYMSQNLVSTSIWNSHRMGAHKPDEECSTPNCENSDEKTATGDKVESPIAVSDTYGESVEKASAATMVSLAGDMLQNMANLGLPGRNSSLNIVAVCAIGEADFVTSSHALPVARLKGKLVNDCKRIARAAEISSSRRVSKLIANQKFSLLVQNQIVSDITQQVQAAAEQLELNGRRPSSSGSSQTEIKEQATLSTPPSSTGKHAPSTVPKSAGQNSENQESMEVESNEGEPVLQQSAKDHYYLLGHSSGNAEVDQADMEVTEVFRKAEARRASLHGRP